MKRKMERQFLELILARRTKAKEEEKNMLLFLLDCDCARKFLCAMFGYVTIGWAKKLCECGENAVSTRFF